MQDTDLNKLRVGKSLEHLRGLIPEEHRGPTFEEGEVVRLRGYYYRVVELAEDRIVLAPWGRSKVGHKDEEAVRRAMGLDPG